MMDTKKKETRKASMLGGSRKLVIREGNDKDSSVSIHFGIIFAECVCVFVYISTFLLF